MSLAPVLPILVLAALAVAVVVARLVVLRRLSGSARTPTAVWRWCGLTAAALLLLLAAARPVLGGDERSTVRVAGDADPNVFLVVDRSASMGVEDVAGGGDRMAGARADIAALIDRYPDARFAVLSFDSRPSLDWPLSADVWSLRPVMSALTAYPSAPDAADQTNVGAAGNVLRYQLIGATQQYPRAPNLVFYLGAGAPGSRSPQRPFDLPEGSVDGGAVLGYGRDANEPALRGVAEQIGVPFVRRDGAAPLADALGDQGTQIGAAAPVAAPAARTELYWIPALGAAILLLIELYLVLREFRRTRQAAADVVV